MIQSVDNSLKCLKTNYIDLYWVHVWESRMPIEEAMRSMAEIIGNTHKPSSTESQDNMALIFTVPDLDQIYQQLRQKSVNFATDALKNPYYGLKTVYLGDPDEILIGLFQALV